MKMRREEKRWREEHKMTRNPQDNSTRREGRFLPVEPPAGRFDGWLLVFRSTGSLTDRHIDRQTVASRMDD
jgi:hypothetical protein